MATLYKMSSNAKGSAEALSCKGEKTRGLGPVLSRMSQGSFRFAEKPEASLHTEQRPSCLHA